MFGVFPEGEVSTPPPPAAGLRMAQYVSVWLSMVKYSTVWSSSMLQYAPVWTSTAHGRRGRLRAQNGSILIRILLRNRILRPAAGVVATAAAAPAGRPWWRRAGACMQLHVTVRVSQLHLDSLCFVSSATCQV